MSTKNYVFMIIFVLVCSVLIPVQPLYAQVSQMVVDEVEQSAPVEDIKSIVPQQDLSNPENQEDSAGENLKTDDETPAQAEVDEQISQQETVKEEESVKEDIPAKTIVSDESDKADVEQKVKEKGSFYKAVSDFFNRLAEVFQKSVFDRLVLLKDSFCQYLSECSFINKFSKDKKTVSSEQSLITIDFAPYYFLNPYFKKDYLEKIVFSDKITNVIELMPYISTIKNIEIKIETPKGLVTPQGVTDARVLINAPSPQISVTGKSMFAKLVIDIRNNTLYKYDKDGFPLKAYLVATGARGTRTMPGLRIVTYKEKFPYSGAPDSKRALDPYSYGPYIIFWNQVEPNTGRQYCVEQLLHGNGNEYSIGRKVSHGCIRTNNNVMRNELSKEVKRGDYILLINPDLN